MLPKKRYAKDTLEGTVRALRKIFNRLRNTFATLLLMSNTPIQSANSWGTRIRR